MIPNYGQVVLNLLLVLFFIAIMMVLLKKFQVKAAQKNQYIKIINSLSIGPKEKILLLEVNNTYLLVGSTAHQIDTLYAFDELKPVDMKVEQLKPLNQVFLDKLKSIRSKKIVSL